MKNKDLNLIDSFELNSSDEKPKEYNMRPHLFSQSVTQQKLAMLKFPENPKIIASNLLTLEYRQNSVSMNPVIESLNIKELLQKR